MLHRDYKGYKRYPRLKSDQPCLEATWGAFAPQKINALHSSGEDVEVTWEQRLYFEEACDNGHQNFSNYHCHNKFNHFPCFLSSFIFLVWFELHSLVTGFTNWGPWKRKGRWWRLGGHEVKVCFSCDSEADRKRTASAACAERKV